MDAAVVFSRFIANTGYRDLPSEEVEVAKKDILDALGALIAGSTLDKAASEVVNLVQEAGGKEESTIISYGTKVPAWMAAFANGAMAHAVDYEDTHDTAVVHVGGCVLPAALAAAERAGGITGKNFIVAYVLGAEILIRMGLARTHPTAWYLFLLPSVMGSFSAAAAASKLMNLTEDQIISAFGLALQQAAGSMQVNFNPGSHVRAIRDSFSGKAGILSALMAQRGIKGVRDSLEGKAGLFNLHFRGQYNATALTDNLGTKWHVAELSFKPWPCSRWIHAHLDATLKMLANNNIKAEDIEDMIATVGISGLMMCDPLEKKRVPETSIDAKASLPYVLAVAALERQVLIGDFVPEMIKNPEILEMAKKVSYIFEPDLESTTLRPGIMEIRTKEGTVYSEKVNYPYGHPQHPITTDDLISKFRDCVRYSAKTIDQNKGYENNRSNSLILKRYKIWVK